jgi:DNA-binding XRE family transcriptional regulator
MTDSVVEANRSSGTAFAELVRTLVDEGRSTTAAAAYLREDWMSGVIALLRAARREAGLTQGEIAERLGTTQSAVARLERGDDVKLSRVWDYLWACGKTPLTVETVAAARLRRYVAKQPSAPRTASAVDRWIVGREATQRSLATSPAGSPSVAQSGIDPPRDGSLSAALTGVGSLSAALTGVDWPRLHSLAAGLSGVGSLSEAISTMDWSGIRANADALSASTTALASLMMVPHVGGRTLGQVVRASLNAGYHLPSSRGTSGVEPATEGPNAFVALADQGGWSAASSRQPAKSDDGLAAEGQGLGSSWEPQQDWGRASLWRSQLRQAAA